MLLTNGADPNLECGKKRRKTPLYYVIKYELVDILKLLLRYAVDVNKRFGLTISIFGATCTDTLPHQVRPLIYGIHVGNAEIIELILQNSKCEIFRSFGFTRFYNICAIQYLYFKYSFSQLNIYKMLIKKENAYVLSDVSEYGNDPENVKYTIFGKSVIFDQTKIVKWILKYKNDTIPKNFMEYHLNIYNSVNSMDILRLFIKYDYMNWCSLMIRAPLDKIIKTESDKIELRKYASAVFASQLDINDYIMASSFLKDCMRKNVINNFMLVLLGFSFDEKCLFHRDYLSRDMCLLILETAKNSTFY